MLHLTYMLNFAHLCSKAMFAAIHDTLEWLISTMAHDMFL